MSQVGFTGIVILVPRFMLVSFVPLLFVIFKFFLIKLIKMPWARDHVTVLINELFKYPCLYAIKSPEYKNKHARIKALKAIQQALPVAKTIEEIKSKIHGLKTTFLAEHRKYKSMFKSGVGEEDVEILQPTLWYYDLLLFLLDHNKVRKGMDNIQLNRENIDPIETKISENMNNVVEEVFEFNVQNQEFVKIQEKVTPASSASNEMSPAASESNIFVQDTPSVSKRPQKRKRNQLDSTLDEAVGTLKQLSRVISNTS